MELKMGEHIAELLAPAGDLEKLKMAILYGADAVYAGVDGLSLRASAGSLDIRALTEGSEYAHAAGKRVYAAVNIFARNDDLDQLPANIRAIVRAGADALIISDPGVLAITRREAPETEIHLSTQANCTNYESANFWHAMGVKRIILARELHLREIAAIRAHTPDSLELELFVHGAMCMAYSGRCLISSHLTGRDANRGDCAQPCRWKYALSEETRPGEYMPVESDADGTYLFNSKDLCLIEHLPRILDSGVTSLKIEGRMKSAYYVATVVSAYRAAIDHYRAYAAGAAAVQGGIDPVAQSANSALKAYAAPPEFLQEVSKASHRAFTTGFTIDPGADTADTANPGTDAARSLQNTQTSAYIRDYDIIGIVKSFDAATGIAEVEQRNRFFAGDAVEVMAPHTGYAEDIIGAMTDAEGNAISSAPHPQMTVYVKLTRPAPPNAILRKRVRLT